MWIGGKAGSGGSGNVGIQTAKVTGTDADGRSMTIVAGASTGAGLPGELIFATSGVGSSGSTENTVATRLKIDNANRILVNTPQAPDGTPPNVLYVNGSAIASTGVQTPSVSGLNDNDASIELVTHLTASTGNGGQIRLEPGESSNNYFRVYDVGAAYGALLCTRNSVTAGLCVRPFKETVTGNTYSGSTTLWDYLGAGIDFTNATDDFVLTGYAATSPVCKGDNYFAFNVGGLGPSTDFTLAAAFHSNVVSNPAADKDAYNFLSHRLSG